MNNNYLCDSWYLPYSSLRTDDLMYRYPPMMVMTSEDSNYNYFYITLNQSNVTKSIEFLGGNVRSNKYGYGLENNMILCMA